MVPASEGLQFRIGGGGHKSPGKLDESHEPALKNARLSLKLGQRLWSTRASVSLFVTKGSEASDWQGCLQRRGDGCGLDGTAGGPRGQQGAGPARTRPGLRSPRGAQAVPGCAEGTAQAADHKGPFTGRARGLVRGTEPGRLCSWDVAGARAPHANPGRACLRCRKGKLRLGADEDALRHTPLRDAGKRLPGRRHPAFRDRGCDGPTPPGGPQAPASGRPSEETVRAGVGEGAGISGGAERQSQREPQRWCEGRPGRRSRCGDTPAGASGRPPGRGQPRLVAASTQTAAGGRRASPASIPPSAEGRRVPFSFLRERPSF